MANCIFGQPIYSDTSRSHDPTLSRGSWVATLPLANVKDRRLERVARSTSAAAADTLMEVDLKVTRRVRVVFLMVANATMAATVRVRASAIAGDFASPIYDSGTVTIRSADLTDEKLGDIKPTVILPVDFDARYLEVAINDTTNPDGYVDVPRLAITGGWQPTVNMLQGAATGLEDTTDRSYTDGAAALYYERPVRRTQDLELDMLSDEESLMEGFDMQRLGGISRQMVFVFDPDDPPRYMVRRSFLCVPRQLTALQYAYVNRNRMPLQLVEEL